MSRTGSVPVLPFDVGTCISLHNKIVHAAHRYFPDLSLVRGYFNHYNISEGYEDFRPHLTDPVAEFLDGIDMNDWEIYLTPEVLSVCQPAEMYTYVEYGGIFPDTNILGLYRSVDFENGRGLVFAMDTHAVTFIECDDDEPGKGHDESDETGFVWVTLQETLQTWWNRIENGEYIANPAKQRPTVLDGEGWILGRYRPSELEDTVSAWEEYINAIMVRMPSPRLEFDNQTLVDNVTLREYNIQGFASAFLSQARTPPFTFIAPGMTIPTAAFVEKTGPEIRTQQEIDSNCVKGAEPSSQ